MGLIPADKSSFAESAHARSISGPAKGACVRAFNKATSSESNFGQPGILVAQISQQCVDALMIALNRSTRSVKLQQAGQNLQRRDGHVSAPSLCDGTIEQSKGPRSTTNKKR